MSYVIEYAKSGRAKCKGSAKTCAAQDRAIASGALRLGVEVDRQGITGIMWRHWECTTPKVIENMKEKLGDLTALVGYNALRPEDADRVRQAWENGKIDDDETTKEKPAAKAPEKPKRGGQKSKAKASKPKETEQEEPKEKEDTSVNATDKTDEKPKKGGRKKTTGKSDNDKDPDAPITRAAAKRNSAKGTGAGRPKRKTEEDADTQATTRRKRGKSA